MALSHADVRQVSQGSGSFLPFLCTRIPSPWSNSRTEQKCTWAREGPVYTHFHQGLLDDSADVPPPLRDVRVVVVQVGGKGQAKRSKFLWGYKSRVITLSQMVLSRSLHTLYFMQSPKGRSFSSTLTRKTLLEGKFNIPPLFSPSSSVSRHKPQALAPA